MRRVRLAQRIKVIKYKLRERLQYTKMEVLRKVLTQRLNIKRVARSQRKLRCLTRRRRVSMSKRRSSKTSC